MSVNSNLQLTSLDFDTLKGSLIGFLRSQDQFKDYNFDGSSLNILLDLLSYNTQYNAYYLNMIGNELFLDSSTLRSSVISHAKLLNYTPKSAIAPTATVNIKFDNVNSTSLSLPAYTLFTSSPINGVNYTFVNTSLKTVNVVNNTALFENVEIKQGIQSSYRFTVDSVNNPSYTFEIPDETIDTTTLQVVIQDSISNTYYEIYNQSTSYLDLDSSSKVYFINESITGKYEISFGDGIIGKKLTDGNIIIANYITTEGNSSAGANNFVLMQTVGGYAATVVDSITPATSGGNKETIESIKYQAPKQYSSQGRAVTKDDYIAALQQNKIGISFDAVNVWSGELSEPPVYGKVFMCLKPQGSYSITETQKERLIRDVIKPISVMTVSPTIIDPDYIYINLEINIIYDQKKTLRTEAELNSRVVAAVQNFAVSSLNTFNSTFSMPDLYNIIQNVDKSIITNEVNVRVQKKVIPNLSGPQKYILNFGVPLERSSFKSGLSSSPSLQFLDPLDLNNIIDGVYIEEIPTSTGGIDSVNILNPGYGYTIPPIVTILGDGKGATATAVLTATGAIKSINITSKGYGYTSAVVNINNAPGDTSGQLGAASISLQGQYGLLRTFYYNNLNVKTIFTGNIGTIDYTKGIITLNDFNPIQVNNDFGQLTITAKPSTTLIESSYNRIITIDTFDPTSIVVNVKAK